MTCIHKWEIRYPLLLPLWLLCVVVPVHMQDSCEKFGKANAACQAAGGYIQKLNADGKCLSSECFGNNTLETHRELLSDAPQLTPKITRSGAFPSQVGVPFDLMCHAWATSTNRLNTVQMKSATTPPLPKPKSRRKWFFLKGAVVTDVAVQETLPMTLAGNRHRQNVTCTMVIGAGGATTEEKAREAKDSLYAFSQTTPVIRGPQEVEAGGSYTWECVTDEVTVDRQSQFRLELYTNPLPPQAPTKEKNLQTLGTNTPLKLKVTQSMKLAVPPSFQPAFFVQCRGENTVLGPGKKVTMPADLLRVRVFIKPNDLSGIFTIVGVSSGLGGFALGAALVVYYCRKKKQTAAALQP